MGSSHNTTSDKGRFITTSWSMVLEAADLQSTESRQAMEQLCQRYWYPLYAFARRKGYQRHDAEDMTQRFFAELLENRTLQSSDSSRGRFRTFLMACMQNFLASSRRRDQAQKRGGNQITFSIDFQVADDRFSHDPGHDLTPEKVFDRGWALSLIDLVTDQLREQYASSDKSSLFEKLKDFLGPNQTQTYSQVADELSMTEGAVKVAVHRMRDRFRTQLRETISRTVRQPSDVDDELQHLFAALN